MQSEFRLNVIILKINVSDLITILQFFCSKYMYLLQYSWKYIITERLHYVILNVRINC